MKLIKEIGKLFSLFDPSTEKVDSGPDAIEGSRHYPLIVRDGGYYVQQLREDDSALEIAGEPWATDEYVIVENTYSPHADQTFRKGALFVGEDKNGDAFIARVDEVVNGAVFDKSGLVMLDLESCIRVENF